MTFGDDSTIIPDLPTPITAYRGWDACYHDGDPVALGGIGGTRWPTDAPLAAVHAISPITYHLGQDDPCAVTPSPPEADDGHYGHGCGIYGYRSPDLLAKHGGRLRVWGEVQLWGTTWEHTGGWRASHGRPTALYRPVLDSQPALDVVEALAAVYGVPVLDMPDTDEMAARAEQEAALAEVRVMVDAFTATAMADLAATLNAIDWTGRPRGRVMGWLERHAPITTYAIDRASDLAFTAWHRLTHKETT